MNKLWRIWAKALGDKSGKTDKEADYVAMIRTCLLYTSPSPRDRTRSRMPSSA